MKAVQINEFGNINVLALNNIKIPTPADNEVLIKVKAAAVNPVDWKIREGNLQPLLNHELPLTLGWDVAGYAIDYRKEDFSTLKDIDVVLDTIGGETQENSWKTLKKGGHLVSIAQTPAETSATQHDVSASFCFIQPNREQLEKLAELADAGQLKVNIDSEFGLDQVSEAHTRSETGRAQGKIIINVSA